MNIQKHPIYKAIYDLCLEIEKLPASEQATKCVVLASALEKSADELLRERDDSKQYSEELAKDICEMEDALGFKQDQTDKDGAFIPTKGPWKDRVRDLIAKEGELGDLKEVLKAEQKHRLAVESVRDALQSERDQLCIELDNLRCMALL